MREGKKMARYAWLAMLALLATTVGLRTYAADSMSADAQAISKIEKEWIEAVKTKDKTFYQKYFAEDVSYISEDAVFSKGRAAYIDMVMKQNVVDASASDERVTVHGTTGIATGKFTMKDSTGASVSTLYTDVYAKGADGWKVVASQETKAK
jgi:ketosteroid isomerase-like protein